MIRVFNSQVWCKVRKVMIILIMGLSLLFYGISQAETDQSAISAAQFTSLSVDTSTGVNHLRLTVKARKAGNFEGILDIKRAAQKSLEHFFIGLSMNDDAFWVNLNPTEPDRIINPMLADTDLGRIMLNSDYRLKEEIGNIINPQASQTGKEFWRRLYQKAEELGVYDRIPVITRLWIVPDITEVYEKQSQVYIAKSSLKVQLESAYLSSKITFKDNKDKELQNFGLALMEELVLPQLNKRINEAYAYADLRDVYNALILASWYKEKFGVRYSSLLKNVDRRILQDVKTEYIFTPNEIYRDYLKSIKEGESTFSETENFASPFYGGIITRHYFIGGIDLRNIRLTNVAIEPSQDTSMESMLFTCDLFIPGNVDRPLQYAKNQIEVQRGTTVQDDSSTIMLAKSLPAITPIRFSDQNMQSLSRIDKTERILLSKL